MLARHILRELKADPLAPFAVRPDWNDQQVTQVRGLTEHDGAWAYTELRRGDGPWEPRPAGWGSLKSRHLVWVSDAQDELANRDAKNDAALAQHRQAHRLAARLTSLGIETRASPSRSGRVEVIGIDALEELVGELKRVAQEVPRG